MRTEEEKITKIDGEKRKKRKENKVHQILQLQMEWKWHCSSCILLPFFTFSIIHIIQLKQTKI